MQTSRNRRNSGAISLALLLACLPASAVSRTDSTSHAADYTVPATVISATRDRDLVDELPASVTTLNRRDIQQGDKGVSLDEALRHVPGLAASNRQNLSQGERLTVRGLGARAAFGVRGLKVLLDGIPLTTPDGQTQLGNIDLATVDRIEILRGPSSSLYGNAGGGVIAIHSAPPVAGRWQIRPGLTIGSDGLRRSQLSLGGGNGQHRLSINLRRVQTDGYRHHSEALIHGASVTGQHQLKPDWRLLTVLNVYDAPYLLNPSSMARADADTRPRYVRGFVVAQGASKQARQVQGGLTLQRQVGTTRSELTLFGVSRSLDNPIPGAVIELDRAAGGVRFAHSLDHDLGSLPLRWQIGLDVEAQRDDRTEYDNEGLPDIDIDAADVPDAVVRGALVLDQQERVRSVAPFAAVDIRPTEALLVTVGGRFDRYRLEADDNLLTDGDQSGSRTLSQFSPSIGASLRLGDLTWTYANFGTAFQTPTTNELSNRVDGVGGFNPQLGPESIVSLEVGARGQWVPARLAWDVAIYHMTVADMLIPFQVDDAESDAVYYRNAGDAGSIGAEAALRTRATDRLELRLSASWMDFTFDDYVVATPSGDVQLAGKRLPGVPPAQVALSARLDLPHRSWAEAATDWTDGYWANDFNGPAPAGEVPGRDFFNDGRTTLDLRVGTSLDVGPYAALLSIGVDNALAARYNGSVTPNAFGNRYFEPAAGRTWHVGIVLEPGVPER